MTSNRFGIFLLLLLLVSGGCQYLSRTQPPSNAYIRVRQQPPVVLSYSIEDNLQFTEDIDLARTTIASRLAGRLCISMTGELLKKKPLACPVKLEQEAVIVHAIVLRDGLVWRFYSSHPATFDRPQSLGSITKVVPGLVALAASGASTNEIWCKKAFADFQNADGSHGYQNCQQSEASVSALRAIATSDNLAWRWRLQKLEQKELRALSTSLGISNIPADYDPSLALAFGHAELSPRQALECFDGLVSSTATRAAFIRGAATQPSALAKWCAEISGVSGQKEFVLQMLQEPARNGTAAHLKLMFPPTTPIFAKTGTPSIKKLDLGKVLIASVVRDGHRYTFLSSVLSPSPSSPLSVNLKGSDFSSLHLVIAKHILGDPS